MTRRAANDVEHPPESGSLTMIEVARRLANIETLLAQLLERRKTAARAGVRRASSLRERVREQAMHDPKPSDYDMEMARRHVAARR